MCVYTDDNESLKHFNLKNMDAQLVASYEVEGYVNRPLSQKEIIKMADMHGNKWHIACGVLYLSECDDDISQYADTTGWQLFDVLEFLNY